MTKYGHEFGSLIFFFLLFLNLHDLLSAHCRVFSLTKEKQPGSTGESTTEPDPKSGAVEFKNRSGTMSLER